MVKIPVTSHIRLKLNLSATSKRSRQEQKELKKNNFSGMVLEKMQFRKT